MPVKQSGHLVQVTGDSLSRSLLARVLENLAYVTVLSHTSIWTYFVSCQRFSPCILAVYFVRALGILADSEGKLSH